MKQTILLLIILFIYSCSLFKETTKTTDLATQSSSNQMESSRLVLKRADKETQIFTYWNDSSFYQVQYIKEQIDQAKLGQLTATEKQEAKHSVNTKKVDPVSFWIYGLILLVLVCCYLIIKKVF